MFRFSFNFENKLDFLLDSNGGPNLKTLEANL
jgi:hypothetical protein